VDKVVEVVKKKKKQKKDGSMPLCSVCGWAKGYVMSM
jgi:hypothetical protein